MASLPMEIHVHRPVVFVCSQNFSAYCELRKLLLLGKTVTHSNESHLPEVASVTISIDMDVKNNPRNYVEIYDNDSVIIMQDSFNQQNILPFCSHSSVGCPNKFYYDINERMNKV